MSDLRKLLETLEDYVEQALAQHDQQYQRHPSTERDRQVIVNDLEALRQALAQPEQEPVVDGLFNELLDVVHKYHGTMVLATALGCLEMVKTQLVQEHMEEDEDDE
jgi:O-succinylbenzoate synthase